MRLPHALALARHFHRHEAAGLGTVPFALPGVHWVGQGPLAAATTAPRGGPGAAGTCPAPGRHFPAHQHPSRAVRDVWPDEEAIRHFLESHGDTLRSQIDRVQGSVEMALRIDLPHPTGGPDAQSCRGHPPGRLPGRPAGTISPPGPARGPAQWATDIYLRALKGLFRQWRRRSPEPPATLRLAFLVPRPQTAAFAQRVAMLRSMQIGQPCRLFGPWPPYSFG